jgi:MoaA/NifB/PqqE/SkfB family radical SAM enzyme
MSGIEEWSDKNSLNSFNSLKGLAYMEHYKNILAWMDGKAKLMPPVECNIDPYAECNLSCSMCIVQRYLRTHREEVGEMRKLPTDYLYRLVDFLASWGVNGICLSGGGEPTLHKGMVGLPGYIVSKGMKASIFTNGTVMTEELVNSLLTCQFVTLSINATDRETYKQIMGVDLFDKMLANLKYIAKRQKELNSDSFTCVRMLILPENCRQIYNMCSMAKEIGLKGFNIRPADYERSDIEGHHKLDLPVDEIYEQFEKCHKLEDENFKVVTTIHKFDKKFHVFNNFNRCLASPLLINVLSNGDSYVCADRKMEERYRLGTSFPEPERILNWWGSEGHRMKLLSINPRTDCLCRCTFNQYHRQMEEVVIKDSMMLCFP